MDPDPPDCRALNTDVVLDVILNKLDNRTLFKCRGVNQKFHKEASSILKRQRAAIWLEQFDLVEDVFNALYSMATSSKYFPFTGLHLIMQLENKFEDLETPAAIRFFQSFGPSFQYLWLSNFVCKRSELAKLLHSYLPNVQTLELGSFELLDSGYYYRQEPMKSLPMLQRIKFRPEDEENKIRTIEVMDLECLIQSAPSLKTIEGDVRSDNVMSALSGTKSWNKISSLTMTSDSALYWPYFRSLAQNPPALTHLVLGFTPRQYDDMNEFTNCVRAILSVSQSTLETLAIGGYRLPVFDWQFRFCRLKTLELKSDTTLHTLGSGVGAHLVSETFPTLKIIRLKMDPSIRFSAGSFCNDQTVWNSVEKLEIYSERLITDWMNMRTALPAVKHVVVDIRPDAFCQEWGRDGLRHLWFVCNFPLLERLEIKTLPVGSLRFHFDEFFTGIPRAICDTLRGMSKLEISEPYDTIMRPYGGITQLRGTKVKELVLWISNGPNLPLPNVSVWYGLECVPDVHVTVKIAGQNTEQHLHISRSQS